MLKLENGNTVIIIGGGPAGTSCAIHLKNLAAKQNIDISVLLIEPKIFGIHYNQCVGVLSPQTRQLMLDMNIPFPEHLTQRKISGYFLNANGEEIYLPSDKHNDIGYALRRNEFDSYMIDQAQNSGVNIVHGEAVTFDYVKNDKKNKFTVYCDLNTFRCNFLVGAFGMGNGIAREFFNTFKYRPPRILQSIVSKIHPFDSAYIDDIFGDNIRAYLPTYKPIEFGAITPKGNHLTVNIAGEKISFKDMECFLKLNEVRKWIPVHKERTYFKGQFPTGPAHNFYGDDYIIIGDAAGLVRPFKGKGVHSAILSGKIAAETIINNDRTKLAIKRNFIKYPQIQKILNDYKYGAVIRKLTIHASHHDLLKYIVTYAKRNKAFAAALYNAVSANKLYKDILLQSPRCLFNSNKI